MPLPVCPACGVLAPEDRALCTLCATAFPEPRPEAPEPVGERRWVCMRARFGCSACAQVSPIRSFSDDDILTCVHCGQRQGFSDGELRDVLEIAHATVDPELRDFEVFDRLEGKATFIDYARDKLSILAAPGHPRCARCHAFVELGTADGATCEVTCACGPQTHHVPRVLGSRLAELRGVVSDETRTDVPRAASASGEGTTAFSCAQCGAAFAADAIGHGPIVACTYCKAANRVDVPQGPKADPIWLLVEGASKKRREHNDAEAKREARPPSALEEIVAIIKAPPDDPTPLREGAYVQPLIWIGCGLWFGGLGGWNEGSGYLEHRARAAMVQTTCTIERTELEKQGDKEVRTYVGTALDPHTRDRQPVRGVGDASGQFPRLGDSKEPAAPETQQILGTLPTTVTCFLDGEHARVVFSRRAGFSPIWMIFFVLSFLASLAGGLLLARKAWRAR